MNHLPFTIAAYLLNAVSVTVDKFLLSKHIPDPLIYVFYFSCYSLLALFLLPFTHLPQPEVFILASASTLIWTTAAYFMFKGLQIGQVSRVIPVIGVLIPLILLVQASVSDTLTKNQTTAVFLLILGLVVLTIHEWRGNFTLKELVFELVSALLFAASYIILREAYLREHFLTVFTYSRPILIPVGAIILLIPKLRHIVLAKGSNRPKINPFSKVGALFAAGQLAGGGSELLITFSIALATPALVNSLQGVQYIFLFLFSLVLSKTYPAIFTERLNLKIILAKILGIILISIGLYLLAF